MHHRNIKSKPQISQSSHIPAGGGCNKQPHASLAAYQRISKAAKS
jgi:hypothetical protein